MITFRWVLDIDSQLSELLHLSNSSIQFFRCIDINKLVIDIGWLLYFLTNFQFRYEAIFQISLVWVFIITLIHFNVRIPILRSLLFISLFCFDSLESIFLLLCSPELYLNLQFSLFQYLGSQVDGVVEGWFLRLCEIAQYLENVLQFLIDSVVFLLDGLILMHGRYLINGYFLAVKK